MTLEDITEKKKLEELISERDSRYQILFEGSTDAALVITTDGIILHANQSACKLFGWTEKELRLMGRKGIVDMNDPRLTELLISRSNARAHSGNLTCIRSSGERFEAEISSVNYRDIDNNELVYVIAREIIKNPARRSGDKRDHFVGGNGSEV